MKIKYKLPKNYVAIVYDEKVPDTWRIVIGTEVLPSRDFEIKGAIVRNARLMQSSNVS